MKKILMVIAIAAMSVSFVACGGSTKPAAEGEATENTDAKAGEAASGSIVDQYQALADKMVELAPKVKAGDMDAVNEYTKLSEDFAKFAQDNAEAFAKLTPEESQKISEIMTKAAQAMQ